MSSVPMTLPELTPAEHETYWVTTGRMGPCAIAAIRAPCAPDQSFPPARPLFKSRSLSL